MIFEIIWDFIDIFHFPWIFCLAFLLSLHIIFSNWRGITCSSLNSVFKDLSLFLPLHLSPPPRVFLKQGSLLIFGSLKKKTIVSSIKRGQEISRQMSKTVFLAWIPVNSLQDHRFALHQDLWSLQMLKGGKHLLGHIYIEFSQKRKKKALLAFLFLFSQLIVYKEKKSWVFVLSCFITLIWNFFFTVFLTRKDRASSMLYISDFSRSYPYCLFWNAFSTVFSAPFIILLE